MRNARGVLAAFAALWTILLSGTVAHADEGWVILNFHSDITIGGRLHPDDPRRHLCRLPGPAEARHLSHHPAAVSVRRHSRPLLPAQRGVGYRQPGARAVRRLYRQRQPGDQDRRPQSDDQRPAYVRDHLHRARRDEFIRRPRRALLERGRIVVACPEDGGGRHRSCARRQPPRLGVLPGRAWIY